MSLPPNEKSAYRNDNAAQSLLLRKGIGQGDDGGGWRDYIKTADGKVGLILALSLSIALLTNVRQLSTWVCPIIALILAAITLGRPRHGLILLLLIAASLVSGLFTDGWLPLHYLTSIILTISLGYLWLLPNTSQLWPRYERILASFDYWIMPALTVILLVNNAIGLYDYWIHPHGPDEQYDDAFIGFYGRSGTAMHGLAVINSTMATLYLLRFYLGKQSNKLRWSNLVLALAFGVSSVLCFYGLGLALWLAALGLVMLFNLRNWAFCLMLIVYAGLMLGISTVSSPKTMAYTLQNISDPKAIPNDVNSKTKLADINTESNEAKLLPNRFQHLPRKLQMFSLYASHYPNDWQLLLFGSGPGTFCSRIVFLLGGEYSSKVWINDLKPTKQPQFAEVNILPLWSKSILQLQYADGTRNQPFSSMMAMLAEYGLLFTLLFVWASGHMVWLAIKRIRHDIGINTCYKMSIVFLSVFLLANLMVDNLAEGSEFLVLLVLLKWLMRQGQPIMQPTIQPTI